MPIVDSHCHASPTWYEPIEVLRFQMARNGVDHAILIQMNQQFDNRYQTECLRRFPGQFASVVYLDVQRPDAVAELERLKAEGASGVRLRPDHRSPGSDPLAIWRAAERLGLAVSCSGSGEVFAAPEFAAVIEAVPNLTIVVEHLGSVNHPDGAAAEALRQRVFGLARYPNVCIKIHGLGEFTPRALPAKEPFPFVEPIPRLLEQVYRAFGPRRLMWGSDYPPVSSREGYANALHFTMEQFSGLSASERDEIFGGTALRVFPLH
jgi:L-fuconolactonase